MMIFGRNMKVKDTSISNVDTSISNVEDNGGE
jgi:hypothetical protein